MTRELPEWVGKTPNSRIPDRVHNRVRKKADHRCQSCHRLLVYGERGEIDHKQPLINNGENRENNLQLLCRGCHRSKTKDDVALKSYNYRRQLAHAGIKQRKSRPMPFGKTDYFKRKVTGEVVARRLHIKW